MLTEPDPIRLLHRPYTTPPYRPGARVRCELRGTVVMVGLSDGPIAWTLACRRRGKQTPAMVLYGDLARAVRLLRSNFPDVRVVAMCGECSNGSVNFLPVAAAFGADATLLKPFPMFAMLGVVENPLRDRQKANKIWNRNVRRWHPTESTRHERRVCPGPTP